MPVASLGVVVPENSIRFLGHDTHEHDLPHLIYVVTGTAQLVIDGADLVLHRHEAVWLAPHVPHSARLSDDGLILGPILEAHVAPSQRIRPLGVIPALVDLMTTVLGAAPATGEQVRPFREAIGRMLRRVSGQYFPVTLPAHPTARALARDAVRSSATLDLLAAEHRMSPRQVQRIFLEETGFPFARWRSRARMNVAVAHILGGGTITAAAPLAGYATRAGLLRALSRESGVPISSLSADPVLYLDAHG